MKTLFLLRHAKSAWNDLTLDDHDRPLDARGERAALVMGRYLRQSGAAPEIALLSTARRVRETFELVAEQLAAPPKAEWHEDLYMADAADMLAALSGVPEDTAEVLMCAHNPGMEEFAARFAGGGEAGALARLEIKFPTAALAVFRIGKKWAKQGLGKGELVAFVTPKDLV